MSGYPDPEVIWFKDNVPVKNTPKTKITGYYGLHTLFLPKVLPDDSGSYQVAIRNTSGMIESACKLVVEGKINGNAACFGALCLALEAFLLIFCEII